MVRISISAHYYQDAISVKLQQHSQKMSKFSSAKPLSSSWRWNVCKRRWA